MISRIFYYNLTKIECLLKLFLNINNGAKKMLLVQMTEENIRNILGEELDKKLSKILDEMKNDSKNGNDENKSLTLDEAAKYLRVSKPTLHRLMNDSEISYFKVRRRTYITRESLDEYIRSNTNKAE